jgi:hypothetical protein
MSGACLPGLRVRGLPCVAANLLAGLALLPHTRLHGLFARRPCWMFAPLGVLSNSPCVVGCRPPARGWHS